MRYVIGLLLLGLAGCADLQPTCEGTVPTCPGEYEHAVVACLEDDQTCEWVGDGPLPTFVCRDGDGEIIAGVPTVDCSSGEPTCPANARGTCVVY